MLHHQMKTVKISCCQSPEESLSASEEVDERTRVPYLQRPTFEMMKTKLIEQTETIAKLKANLRKVERSLDAQHQETTEALLIREQEWKKRVEMLERQLQCLEGSTTRSLKSIKQLFCLDV